jgi:pimeloyl-ACP methyl ester carboxylesterase
VGSVTRIGHLEAGGRQLLTSLHLAQRLRPRGVAVLLCNPFGEEASRAHRSFRVLATRLRDAGYSTLRFDYSGTGDSAGDAASARLETWIDDLAAAAAHLRHVSGVSRVALLGLRLGASLAALACARGGVQARHLLLWDPVVEGAHYLRELDAAHQAYLRSELGDGWVDRRARHADGSPTEALGTPIGADLAAALRALDLAGARPPAEQITVLPPRDATQAARLRAVLPPGAAVRWLDGVRSSTWDSDAALNAAVVPAEEIAALVARIEEISP